MHPADGHAGRAATATSDPSDLLATPVGALREDDLSRRVLDVRARRRDLESQAVSAAADPGARGPHHCRVPALVLAILLRSEPDISKCYEELAVVAFVANL